MARRWLLLLAAVGVIALNAIVFATFWPPPTPPPNASRAQRLYFAHCVTCHGVRGNGSWRATLFLIRPGDLSDSRRMQGNSDQYLFEIIKHGGAPIGKPGMPAFGFHLSDAEIQDLVHFLRMLSVKAAADLDLTSAEITLFTRTAFERAQSLGYDVSKMTVELRKKGES